MRRKKQNKTEQILKYRTPQMRKKKTEKYRAHFETQNTSNEEKTEQYRAHLFNK